MAIPSRSFHWRGSVGSLARWVRLAPAVLTAPVALAFEACTPAAPVSESAVPAGNQRDADGASEHCATWVAGCPGAGSARASAAESALGKPARPTPAPQKEVGDPVAEQTARAEDHGASPPPSAPPIDVPPDMVLVPAGTFTMGANDEGEMDERPAHRVTVPAFLLDITEVTQAAYKECVIAKVCRPASTLEDSRLTNGMAHVFRRPEHPVAGVSWDDAAQYCQWRGRRLPTEAEWERAARGDDDRRYVWGNEAPEPARHGAFGGRATTEPVGSFPAGQSAYGNLDLAGNLWEWVADDYDPFAYQRLTAATGTPGSCEEILDAQNQLRREGKQGFTGTNPIPTICEKVLRGGAYNYPLKGLRNSNRVHHPARFRIAVAGFRCAGDLSVTEPE